jgi:predicted metal-dependent enzyme (double-stranded beta helix superfamily)
MAYELDQFITDCHSILSRDPGPSGREEVRTKLEHLLHNKDFVKKHCEDAPRGLHLLHEDKHLGFQILAHINDKARVSPPHDHGASWAIYGQATDFTDMTEWRRTKGDGPGPAEIEIARQYRLEPGHAGTYDIRAIHSIDYPDGARFVRVTGRNLDRVPRLKFNLKTHEAEVIESVSTGPG